MRQTNAGVVGVVGGEGGLLGGLVKDSMEGGREGGPHCD
jgi:hypothetical protein